MVEATKVCATKLPGVWIHQHGLYWGFRSHRGNSSQKYRLVDIRVADPDCARLAGHAIIADLDVVIACRQIDARAGAQCNVAVTGGVAKQGKRSLGGVPAASGVAEKRRSASSRILICSV